MQYWHMQMHPTGEMKEFAQNIEAILEHKKIIGLGKWDEGEDTIAKFINDMSVNDIVAIKRGGELVALVQIIGGAYTVSNDTDPKTGWIINRRPIRVLDWAIEPKIVPHTRGTITKCTSEDAETNKIIREWHEQVIESFKKRAIGLTV